MAYFPFRPALRTVNSVGAVVAGPLRLWQPSAASAGLVLRSCSVEYPPELLGPYMNTGYALQWRLLGYRPQVELVFPVVIADGASGFAQLLSYYVAGLASESYAALQFNLYETSCNVWRGMLPSESWAPRPMSGKWATGYECGMTLRARDLVTGSPGDWTAGTW